MTLQTNQYFLSPVEVVKVTPKNLEEVAKWCGGKVAETESRRVEGRMDKYVWVPTPKGSAISWAFPGMYITKRVVITENDDLKVTYSVFRKAYFKANYFQSIEQSVENTWGRQAKENGSVDLKTTPLPTGANPEMMRAMLKAQTKDQIKEGPVVGIESIVNVTEPNQQGSMVQQREAIAESLTEQAAGDPHRP